MTKLFIRSAALLLPLAAAGPALAHGGHVEGFAGGFAHPLLGVDHLVAMLAVGLWAAQAGIGRGVALPGMFLLGMAGGIGLGVFAPLPGGVEHGVAATVLVLGLLVALAVPLRAVVALPLALVFGLLHGAAHGGEIGGAFVVTAGAMLLASAALHGVGFALGHVAAHRLARMGGAAVAATGAVLLALT